ncbi:uncharacterized protein [Macrobrachium rosenbergii]|uniref:uncharacterized protein n=1 Tax=Macrobrachium rosenbergii TaxID=79674 RepID=UPI0034D732F3
MGKCCSKEAKEQQPGGEEEEEGEEKAEEEVVLLEVVDPGGELPEDMTGGTLVVRNPGSRWQVTTTREIPIRQVSTSTGQRNGSGGAASAVVTKTFRVGGNGGGGGGASSTTTTQSVMTFNGTRGAKGAAATTTVTKRVTGGDGSSPLLKQKSPSSATAAGFGGRFSTTSFGNNNIKNNFSNNAKSSSSSVFTIATPSDSSPFSKTASLVSCIKKNSSWHQATIMAVNRSISATSSQLSSYHCTCPCHKDRQQSALSAFNAPFSSIIPPHFKLGRHGTTRISWSRYNTPKTREVASIINSPKNMGVSVASIDLQGYDSEGSKGSGFSRSTGYVRPTGGSLMHPGQRSVSDTSFGSRRSVLGLGSGRMGKTITETATRVYTKDGKRYQEIVETVTREDDDGNVTKTTKTTTKELDPFGTRELTATIDIGRHLKCHQMCEVPQVIQSSSSYSDCSPSSDSSPSSKSSSTSNSSSDSDSSQDLDSDDSVIDKSYVPNYEEDTDDDGNVSKDDQLQRPNQDCDQCNISTAFAEESEKADLKESYDRHLLEKELPRSEKATGKTSADSVVAVYDLQAHDAKIPFHLLSLRTDPKNKTTRGASRKSSTSSNDSSPDRKGAKSQTKTKSTEKAKSSKSGLMGKIKSKTLGGDKSSDSDSSDEEEFIEEVYKTINEHRKKHGVKPLKLSKEINKHAKEWAKKLAADEKLAHRPDNKYGENVYCVSSNSSTFKIKGKEVTDKWYSEIKDHVFGEEPKGSLLKSGHFSQMIWKDSKQVGIGYARSAAGTKIFVVANFDPQGNWLGQFATQVPPVGGFSKTASKEKSSLTAPAKATAKSSSSSSSSDSSEEGDFAEECLKAHNNYRKKHGVPPLKLNKDLSKFAKEWAQTIAKKNVLQHRDNNKYGENIYCAWSSNPNHKIKGSEAVESWYSEIKDYTFGKEPSDLRAGHFTQVVWQDSKELGVGFARSPTGKIFVVANYNPAGNFVGSFATKVPRPK